MKKSLKLISFLFIVLGLAVMLAGCGNKDVETSSTKKNNEANETKNEIAVSKEKVVHGEYIRGGGYDSNIEMTFSGDNKLTKLVLTYDCATEEDAQKFFNDSKKDIEGTDTVMVINGKKVTVTFSAEGYMKMAGLTEDKIDEGTMRQVAMGMGYNMKD